MREHDMEEDEDELISLDDPRIPEEVRVIAKEFGDEVCWVGIVGREYWLLDAYGELIEAIWFE